MPASSIASLQDSSEAVDQCWLRVMRRRVHCVSFPQQGRGELPHWPDRSVHLATGTETLRAYTRSGRARQEVRSRVASREELADQSLHCERVVKAHFPVLDESCSKQRQSCAPTLVLDEKFHEPLENAQRPLRGRQANSRRGAGVARSTSRYQLKQQNRLAYPQYQSRWLQRLSRG